MERRTIERTRLEPSLGNILLDEAVQSRFKERRLSFSDRFHFIQVAVNTEYVVSNFREACGAHAANVSQAHHNYVLLTCHAVRCDLIRREFIMVVRTVLERGELKQR